MCENLDYPSDRVLLELKVMKSLVRKNIDIVNPIMEKIIELLAYVAGFLSLSLTVDSSDPKVFYLRILEK